MFGGKSTKKPPKRNITLVVQAKLSPSENKRKEADKEIKARLKKRAPKWFMERN